jgi:flagellar biosynthesis/type III secretory pathway protein FliH
MDAIKELKEYDGYIQSEQYKIRHRVIQEIKQLRLANSDLQMHYDHARTECDKLHLKIVSEYERGFNNGEEVGYKRGYDDGSWTT